MPGGARRCAAVFGFGGRLAVVALAPPQSSDPGSPLPSGDSDVTFGAYSAPKPPRPTVRVLEVGALLTAAGDAPRAAMAAWPGPLAAAPASRACSHASLAAHFQAHAAFYTGAPAAGSVNAAAARDNCAAPHDGSAVLEPAAVDRGLVVDTAAADAKLLWGVLLALVDNGGSLAPGGTASMAGGSESEGAAPDAVTASLVALLLEGSATAGSDAGGGEAVEPPAACAAYPRVALVPPRADVNGGAGTAPAVAAPSLAAVQTHLCRGERGSALAAAVSGGHWPVALLLASSLGPAALARTAAAFTEASVPPASALSTALALYAGSANPIGRLLSAPSDAAAAAAVDSETQGARALGREWRQHAALLLAHRGQRLHSCGGGTSANGGGGGGGAAHPSSSAAPAAKAALVALADALWASGPAAVPAAHALYLLAGATGGLEPPHAASRVVLPGLDHRRLGLPPAAARDAGCLHRAELLELARRRGNAQAVTPALQPFKLAYAALAADCGLLGAAAGYVAHVRVVLRDAGGGGGGAPPSALRCELEALDARLKGCGRSLAGGPATGGGGGGGGSLAGLTEGAGHLAVAAAAGVVVGTALTGLRRMLLGGGGGGSGGSVNDSGRAADGEGACGDGSAGRRAAAPAPAAAAAGAPAARSHAPPLPPSALHPLHGHAAGPGSSSGGGDEGMGSAPFGAAPFSAASSFSPSVAGSLSARSDGPSHTPPPPPPQTQPSLERRQPSSVLELVATSAAASSASVGSAVVSAVSGALSSGRRLSLRGLFAPKTTDDGRPVYTANLPVEDAAAKPFYDDAAGRWVFPGGDGGGGEGGGTDAGAGSSSSSSSNGPPLSLPAGMPPPPTLLPAMGVPSTMAAGGVVAGVETTASSLGGGGGRGGLAAQPPSSMGGGGSVTTWAHHPAQPPGSGVGIAAFLAAPPPLPPSAAPGAGSGGRKPAGARRYVDTFNPAAAVAGAGAPTPAAASSSPGGGRVPALRLAPGTGFGGGAPAAAAAAGHPGPPARMF